MLRFADFTAIAGPVSAYAPPFMRMRACLARITPSARTAVFRRTVASSRRQVSIDSLEEKHSRTGRLAFREIAAASGSIFTEAFPPNPPPT